MIANSFALGLAVHLFRSMDHVKERLLSVLPAR